jgi:hypothetical protein
MTANDVFEISMSLIDERLDTGVVDATSTTVYKKNAPYLLTLLQNDLVNDSNYFKTYTITRTAVTDTAGDYYPNTMPSDFFGANQVISIETNGTYENASDYKWESNNILLIPDSFIGTIKVVYKPLPSAITALTDSLVLDKITCSTTLAYGLASRLLTNENSALANYFNTLYDESRTRNKSKQVATSEVIKDVYGLSY